MTSTSLYPARAFRGSAPRSTPAVAPIHRNVISSAAGAISLVLGVATLIGWMLDISLLKTVLPGFVNMKANTALCFMLLGVALVLPRATATLVAGGVAAIALLTLAEYLGLKVGIDEIFFRDGDPLSVNAPGRSSVTSTVALLLIAAALLLARRSYWVLAAQASALAAAALAWLAILGYTSGVKDLYGLPGLTPIALHTALGFLVVSVGVLALRPEVGVVRLLISKTAGGLLLRRLAPVVILGPMLLGWFCHIGVQSDLYSRNVSQWLFLSGLLTLLLVALVTAARTVERTESELVEMVRRENEQNLDRFFTLSRELLCIADIDGCLLRVNPTWKETLGWTIDDLTGKPFLDFVHSDDREGTLGAVEELTAGQAAVGFENRFRCSDGSFRWLQWSSTAAPEQGLIYIAGRDITERKHAEEALRRLAEELEQRFAARTADLSARTADLSAANEELEAFAYSVSHDLRAPLRGIDGFSQAVLEEYSELLDETGKDYLNRLRAASQRMGVLIDDMLSLSRVSRVELIHAQVDLSAIATSVAAEVQEREPGRQVDFVIPAGVAALGDSRFLRIVLENLLANAFKFTSTRAIARIEFGSEQVNGEDAYFVRDDGVGFDMTYADQLFVPFQRLHTGSEFPGSGIGLATIQRIVRRHGGRAWADGEVGRGATVYFTLGGIDEHH
jgi:PAS domain S-box-containing protein